MNSRSCPVYPIPLDPLFGHASSACLFPFSRLTWPVLLSSSPLVQPAVNGAKSDHPVFGWGGQGGRVYQKSYVEFFTSPSNLKK